MKIYNDEQLIKLADDLFNRIKDPTITLRERVWFRNILYYIGEQWLEWLVGSSSFRRITASDWQTTPVTNIIRDNVRSMKALILNKDFMVKVWPNSMESEDKDAAKMGEFLLRHMDAENDEEFVDETEKIAVWTILCGLGLMRTFPVIGDHEWGMDPDGTPAGKSKVCSTNWSPFNFAVSPFGDDLRSKEYIGIKSLKSREWVEDTFHIILQRQEEEAQIINYERKLAKLVSAVSPWKGQDIEDMSEFVTPDEDLVLVKELEFRPHSKLPLGRFVGTCGTQVLWDHNRLPIKVNEDNWYYTITDYKYHYVPGRYFPDSATDDLISPQNIINEIDQDVAMNRKSLARPIVILSSEANIQRATKWGQHLLVIKYDALTSGGQAPKIQGGVPYPNTVLEERAIHRGAAQDAAGDPKNVLRGSAPSGQASGIMVDILRDAAEQGHFPDILRFYRSHKRTYRKRLLLAAELYTDERMLKISGKGHGVEVRAFKAADLRGNTDVRLELSSGIASTRVGQTQMLLQLTEAGFFSSQSDIDPEFRDELLKRMGLSGFKDRLNVDVERALNENQMMAHTTDEGMIDVPLLTEEGMRNVPIVGQIFITVGPTQPAMDPQTGQPMVDPMTGQPMPGEPTVLSDDPLFVFDNHAVHYEVHRKFVLSSEFQALPLIVQEIAIAHANEHKTAMELAIAEQEQNILAQQGALTPPGENTAGIPPDIEKTIGRNEMTSGGPLQ